MKQPSLHITEQNLARILFKVIEREFPDYAINQESQKNLSRALARDILIEGRNYNLSHRGILNSTKAMDNKVERLTASTKSDASLFAHLLLLERRRLKHRGISLIKPGDREWLELKATCKLATEFCKEFGLARKEGYLQYIKLGLSKVNKYTITKLKLLHPTICSYYDAYQELEMDPSPSKTEEVYVYYNKCINEKVGWEHNDYKTNPEKYVCFKRAKEEADRLHIEYTVYIRAQFWAMEYRSGIPDPHQLYGEKAIERLRKYCYENKINMGNTKKFTFSKKLKNPLYDTDSIK